VSSVTQKNPIRLFVCHVWQQDDDYLRIFEYLESVDNFFYLIPALRRRPPGDREALRDDLRRQIRDAEGGRAAGQTTASTSTGSSSAPLRKAYSTRSGACWSLRDARDDIAPAVLKWVMRWCSWDQRAARRRHQSARHVTRRRRASTLSSSSSIDEDRDPRVVRNGTQQGRWPGRGRRRASSGCRTIRTNG